VRDCVGGDFVVSEGEVEGAEDLRGLWPLGRQDS